MITTFKKHALTERGAEPTRFERVKHLVVSDMHNFAGNRMTGLPLTRAIYATDADEIMVLGDLLDWIQFKLRVMMSGYVSKSRYKKSFDVMAHVAGIQDNEILPIAVMLHKARKGASVTVFTGNHDVSFELLDGQTIDGIQFRQDGLMTAPNGKLGYALHGHSLDANWVQKNPWLYELSWALDAVMLFEQMWARNGPTNDMHNITDLLPKKIIKKLAKYHGTTPESYRVGVDRVLSVMSIPENGFPLSRDLKQKFKSFSGKFHESAMALAKIIPDIHFLIAGHIHQPVLEQVIAEDGRIVEYINSGDGHMNGTFGGFDGGANWIAMNESDIPMWAKALYNDPAVMAEIPNAHVFLQKLYDVYREHNSLQREAAKKGIRYPHGSVMPYINKPSSSNTQPGTPAF